MGKAVVNHVAEVRGSIPSTDVGKEADREIFSPVSDASVAYSSELHLNSNCTPFLLLFFVLRMQCQSVNQSVSGHYVRRSKYFSDDRFSPVDRGGPRGSGSPF